MFLLLCEQGALHFHFSLGPTNYVAGSNVPYSIWLACISGKWGELSKGLCVQGALKLNSCPWFQGLKKP